MFIIDFIFMYTIGLNYTFLNTDPQEKSQVIYCSYIFHTKSHQPTQFAVSFLESVNMTPGFLQNFVIVFSLNNYADFRLGFC